MPFPLPSDKTGSATLLINKNSAVMQAMCIIADKECQIVGYDGLYSITSQSLVKKLVEMAGDIQMIDINDGLFGQTIGANPRRISRQIPNDIYQDVEGYVYLPVAYALY